MKKVAICGFASSSRTLAPFNDDNFEIWTMNHAPLTWIPKWHVLFEMHSMDHLRKVAAHSTDPTAYMDWLTKQPGPEDPKHCPIYMLERDESIPASVSFPRAEVNAWFAEQAAKRDGYFAMDYYTSTVSYMLALAMMQGREEIHLYGIDLLQDDEYCVGPETRVLKGDLRWVRAGDVKVGDVLVGFDEDRPVGHPYRRWQPACVEVVQRLRRPGRKIHTADGKQIVCSAEHRWLTKCGRENRWRTTDELVYPGHPQYRSGKPTRLFKAVEVWDEDRSWDAGYLAAALDGEGCLCQTSHRDNNGTNMKLSFGQRDNAMAQEFEATVKRLGFKFKKGRPGPSGVSNYLLHGGRSETLRCLGTVRPRRLLKGLRLDALGYLKIAGVNDEAVPVVRVEDIGEQEVIGLRTSTRTFIAEGFATHNSYQRAGAEYLIGLARGIGIKVYVPRQSALCAAGYVYGYTKDPDGLGEAAKDSPVNILTEYVADKADTCEGLITKSRQDANTFHGAMQMADLVLGWLDKGGDGNGKDVAALVKEKKADLETKFKAAHEGCFIMQGQAEAFKTVAVWGKHLSRGGSLKL